jgi:uncharacterized protein
MSVPAQIVVFTKEPLPGLAKTRLGKEIGHEAASSLARVLLEDVVCVAQAAALEARAELWIAHTPDHPTQPFLDELRTWAPEARLAPQGTGDLGQRLARGLASRGPRIALGSDTPDLDPTFLALTLAALEPSQVTLGPAPDGGYYLLGLGSGVDASHLEAGIEWSSQTTLGDTRARFEAAGVRVEIAPQREDVDDLPSLRRLAGRIARATPRVAPATRGWLRAHPVAAAEPR